MRRLLTVALLLAAPLCAEQVQKLVILKYAQPRDVVNLLRMFASSISENTDLHALAINAEKDKWPAIEEAVKQLDVRGAAAKNVEINVAFVVGTNKDPQGLPVTADLQPVIAQLKTAFPYKEYRLMDSLSVRSGLGTVSEANGQMLSPTTAPAYTHVRVMGVSVSPDGVVHLRNLRAGMKIPSSTNAKGEVSYTDNGINTDVDVKDGQKVVVGKYSVEGPEKAMFLILTAKVL